MERLVKMIERNKRMKVLLVYPEFPDTYWSFKHALPFAGKRSAYPPLDALRSVTFRTLSPSGGRLVQR